ncbi:alpha/beta hydrolase [Lysobacter sp. TY2-98]|uniref:serine aminopeptidase domain-containing protein n=1 Tax=Lysobacter sp. TY2-98 TaxID=2290922 RepID=UPI000E20A8A9|nr:alpha/beta hydrolase [Lysobacter sp. TY2-98]AXK71273.1 alpha/beta hydrolase [Lysobacter sp. TY2-98]
MTAVVILPGLDGTTSLLEEFCSAVAERGVPAHAIAYPRDRPLGYNELEPLARAQLPSSRPFVLLGESFSGPLAIRIAAAPPPGLVGLVLSTTFARAPVRGISALAPLVRFAPARPPMPLLSWALLGAWATPHLQAQLAAALQSVTPAVLRLRAAAAMCVDVSELLGRIRVPVLQLTANNDRLLAASASAELAKSLPSCQTIALLGPHLLLQTATQQSAQAVAAFALGLGPNNSSKPTPLRGAA